MSLCGITNLSCFVTEKGGTTSTLHSWFREVLGSNLGQETRCFRGFSLFHSRIFGQYFHLSVHPLPHTPKGKLFLTLLPSKPHCFLPNPVVTYLGLAWLIIMGSEFDDWIYWHFFKITINYYSSHTILTAEASLHSDSRFTTGCKRPSLSPINLRHGLRTENTLRTPYPSNSSIVIEVCLRCRCIETAILLLLPAYSFPRECVSNPLPSNGSFRHTVYAIIRSIILRYVV
jgi:hypothetical protein